MNRTTAPTISSSRSTPQQSDDPGHSPLAIACQGRAFPTTTWTRFAWFALLFFSGCSEDAAPTKPNVLVITVDTTRRDYMGFHGKSPSPTPHLDRLAAEAIVFEDAYTVAPLTLPAHSSLMTGLYPAAHGVRDNSLFRLSPSAATLAEILREEGYQTGASVAAFVLQRGTGIEQGFAEFSDPPRDPSRQTSTMAELRAPPVIEQALRDLDSWDAGPFFYWLHLFDPHFPYDAPNSQLNPVQRQSRAAQARAYEEEIRYADEQLGRFFEALKARGLWNNLVVVFASDHGEGLGEGRETTHGHFVYDATIRIPLFLRVPGHAAQRSNRQASLVDVVPTLLDVLDVERPDLRFDGVSLLTGSSQSDAERPVAMESYNVFYSYGWAPQEAVVQGPWKFIHSRNDELYQRDQDPLEQKNLLTTNTARADALRKRIEAAFANPPNLLPSESRQLGVDELEILNSLGYVEGQVERVGERPRAEELPSPVERAETLRLVEEVTHDLVVKNYAGAIAKLETLVAQEPSSALFRERLGTALLALGQHLDDAELHLRKAAALNANRAKVHHNLGLIATRRLAQQQAEPGAAGSVKYQEYLDEAINRFRWTLRIEPGHPRALANLAQMLERKVLGMDPMIQAAEIRDTREEAVQCIEQFLELVPPTDQHWKTLETQRQRLYQQLQNTEERQ